MSQNYYNSSQEVGSLLSTPSLPLRSLLMPDKPLPPSPRFAPTLLLHRRNKTLKEREIRLKAEIAHLKQLLVYYQEMLKATNELVEGTSLGLKRVEQSNVDMKRNEKRIRRDLDVYLQQQGTVIETGNFF